MNKEIRVLFYNNYSMLNAKKGWEQGGYPSQHLWGINLLESKNIKIDILDDKKYHLLNFIGNLTGIKYLDQQIRILFKSRKYDIVYSANSVNTKFLALCKMLGIMHTPIITLMHNFNSNKSKSFKNKTHFLFNKLYFRSIDKVLFLSSINYKEAKELYFKTNERHSHIAWGVDLEFYFQKPETLINLNTKYMMSAGNTGRDFDIIVKAFKTVNFDLHIYATKYSKKPDNIPSNVLFDINIPYDNTSPKLLKEKYLESYVILIPLSDCSSLQGITSLLEAMAMGKAIIMTYNKNIDIDIEKEGIGLYVQKDDEKGWIKNINYLLANPDKVNEMGLKAYKLCQQIYNMNQFALNLSNHIKMII